MNKHDFGDHFVFKMAKFPHHLQSGTQRIWIEHPQIV